MASWRSSMRVVPAWLASPGMSMRQRPCGQMSVPMATARAGSVRSSPPSGASASALPCSTCSSTKRPMRRTASSSRPSVSGSRPALRQASAIETPSASVSDRARSASRAPVMMREPAQAMPKRAPSSSTKLTTPSGTSGSTPASRSASTVASALTTPSGPSKAPPSGTESRCEPMTTPGVAVGVAPPAPLVAGPVLDEVEAARRALGGEPLPQVVVGPGPRVAAVAARRGVRDRRARGRPTSGRSSSSPRSPLLATPAPAPGCVTRLCPMDPDRDDTAERSDSGSERDPHAGGRRGPRGRHRAHGDPARARLEPRGGGRRPGHRAA